MPQIAALGEFEHLVLLAVLQLESEAYAIAVRSCLQDLAGRTASRGALYTTLERLQRKGLLDWETEVTSPKRGGIPRRRFMVTEAGMAAVQGAQGAIARMSEGLGLSLDG